MMRGKIRVIIVLVMAVIVAAVVLWRNNLSRDGNKERFISGNGTIEATEVEVGSKLAGRLLALGVREGERIEKGRLVATLEGGDLEGGVEQAAGALEAARAALAELEKGTRREDISRLEAQLEADEMVLRQARARLDLVLAGVRAEKIGQLKADLRKAEATLAEAEKELARARKLEEEGALPGRDLDRARTARDVALALVDASRQRLAEAEAGARPEELEEVRAAVARAESQVKAARSALNLALAGPRKETIEAARGMVKQASGKLRSAEYMLEQTRIYSPIDGVVTLRNSEPGEVVTPGFPIVRLADLSTVWLKVYIPEPKLGLVKLGQAAEVTTDTYPDRIYSGMVVEIAEKPEFTPKNVQTKEERVKLVFAVKIEIENEMMELKPGMPADATIRFE